MYGLIFKKKRIKRGQLSDGFYVIYKPLQFNNSLLSKILC